MISEITGLSNASKVLANIAPTYFVSVSAIVIGFYAKEGFQKVARMKKTRDDG